jgi:microsomal epoxide hydrolase
MGIVDVGLARGRAPGQADDIVQRAVTPEPALAREGESPVGLPENALTRDEILAGISLYWFTGAIGSSFWPYYARMHRPWPIPQGTTVDVPVGYAAFPREILRPPRAFAAGTYTDIRRWSVMQKGGHFAALEQPQALAREVKAFFAALDRE